MSALTVGAAIGTMLTGLSAITAAYVWTRSQLRDMRQQKAEERRRNWHGYIDVRGIDAWSVQLADEPTLPTTRVVMDIVGEGASATNQAHNMRQRIANDGMLSRSPTPEELDFLKALQRERGYGMAGSRCAPSDLRLYDDLIAARPMTEAALAARCALKARTT